MPTTARWLANRSRPARSSLALAVALGELCGILLILQTALLVEIGNGVIFRGRGLADLAFVFGELLIVIAARAFSLWGSRRAGFACASSVKGSLRRELSARLWQIGPSGLLSLRAGEVAATVVDGVEALDQYYARYLPQRALSMLIPFTVLAVVFPLDWISGLVLVLTAVFLPLTMIVIGGEAHERNQRLWGTLARMSGQFLDVLQGLSTVKMFGAARREAAVIARTSQEYRANAMSVLRIAFLSSFMLELLSSVSIAIVAIVFGMRLLAGAMSFAPAYFVLLIAPEYFLTLRLLGTYYHSRMEAVSAADRVRALLESATPAAFAAEPCPPSRQPAAERATEVTLEEVCFAYGERPVLERVSVRIERGEHVTVMGASGSGKSTLLSLLLRFNDPQRGRILVDGAELSGRDPEQWRQRVAWLPQHPTLFHGTIRENIRLGRLSATDEQLRGAAERACVMEFAQRLPGGLDALVGERGQGLSVGQIQRVALARLFLRDPALVLLDEPTAHLDLESEQLVLQGIRDLAKGRTMILVTHRQAAVAPGNRLFLVEAGTLRGAG